MKFVVFIVGLVNRKPRRADGRPSRPDGRPRHADGRPRQKCPRPWDKFFASDNRISGLFSSALGVILGATSVRQFGWICNPAVVNIRISNPCFAGATLGATLGVGKNGGGDTPNGY